MSSSYFVNIYLYYRDVILLIEIESLLTNHRLSSLTNDRSCSTWTWIFCTCPFVLIGWSSCYLWCLQSS